MFVEAGKSITASAGKDGEPDFYYFVGVAGSRVTISLDSATDALLALHTPRGEEMLYASGKGDVTLEAVLPLTHAFLISVSRAEPGKTYTLRVTATTPDLHEMLSASGIGFARTRKDSDTGEAYLVKSCWVDPGRTYRRIYPKGTEEISLGRGGMEYAKIQLRGQALREMQREVRFVGMTAIIPTRTATGTRETRIELSEIVDPATLGPFERYRCKS